MKTSLIAILIMCTLTNAGADTNIIVMSEWSQPISLRNEQLHDQYIRGRLLIVQGIEPAYGGPPMTNGTMNFIELQNVSGACCDAIEVYFDPSKLNFQLSDEAGIVPKLDGGIWSGPLPSSPVWVNLPYNSTIRLFMNSGRMEPLSIYPSGDPVLYWSISKGDTNTYYLAGTMGLSTHSNLNLSPSIIDIYYKEHCTAIMEFPRFRISPKHWAEQGGPGYPPQGVGSPDP